MKPSMKPSCIVWAVALVAGLIPHLAFGQEDDRLVPPAKPPHRRPATKERTRPTLEETGVWLKQTLEGLGEQVVDPDPDGNEGSLQLHYDRVELSGCTLIIEATAVTARPPFGGTLQGVTRSRSAIPLDELDPARIAVIEPKPGEHLFVVDARTVGGKKEIDVHETVMGGRGGGESNRKESSATLRFTNRDTAERVARALARAARLCGATAEPPPEHVR